MRSSSLRPPSGRSSSYQRLSTVAVALVALVLLNAAVAGAVGQVGDPAGQWAPSPDHTLFDTAGTPHSLDQYQDRVLLLFFAGYG